MASGGRVVAALTACLLVTGATAEKALPSDLALGIDLGGNVPGKMLICC